MSSARPLRDRTRTARLQLEALEARTVPAFLTTAELVVGSDAGAPPLVRLIDPSTQTEQGQFLAFEPNFLGGVRVAVGEVTGDNYPDLVVAAGPGGGPAVKVYDGRTGAVVSSFMAFEAEFSGGVNVAVGDVNGNGRDEIIVGAGGGGGPVVRVFDGLSGNLIGSFTVYDPAFLGGVRVAAGDFNGNGRAEIVTAPGVGGGPDVRIYEFVPNGAGNLIGGFAGFDPTFLGGVYVAAADVTGDGLTELIVGAGGGGGPRIGVFTADGQTVASYLAYASDFTGGVRVSAANLTAGDFSQVLSVPGPTGASHVNVFDGTGPSTLASLFGFPRSQMTGFFVDGSPMPLNIPSTPADQVSAAFDQIRAGDPGRPVAGAPPFPVAGIPLGFNPFFFNPGFYNPFLFGTLFFDAPGLFAPRGYYYETGFFVDVFNGPAGFDPFFNDPFFFDPFIMNNPGFFYDPLFFDPFFHGSPGVVDPFFVDPFFVDPFFDPFFYDPFFYDPFFYDPFFYDPFFYDPFFYDPFFFDPFFAPTFATDSFFWF